MAVSSPSVTTPWCWKAWTPELPGASSERDPDFDAPLLDLWLGADGRGLAVGAYGLAFSTEDHGRTWARREIDPEEPHFYAIRQAADGTLFIAGEFGTFLRSRDGGATWKRLHTGYEGTFFGLRPGRDGRLLLHGLRGPTLRKQRRRRDLAQPGQRGYRRSVRRRLPARRPGGGRRRRRHGADGGGGGKRLHAGRASPSPRRDHPLYWRRGRTPSSCSARTASTA